MNYLPKDQTIQPRYPFNKQMKWLEKFTLTLSYITCIPLRGLGNDQNQLSGLANYLAPAGFFIGLLLICEYELLNYLHASQILSAAIITISWFLITGGLHFDGLMDTADGIFSHSHPERMIEIMSDSRTGNFGAIVGMSVLLVKFACLACLSPLFIKLALLLIPGWARWCETYAISSFPYAKKSGKGKIWHDTCSFPQDTLLSSIVPLLITFFIIVYGNISWTLISTIAIVTVVIGSICALWLNSVLKGHTGDTYGCVVEISETFSLVVLALLSQN